MNNTNFATINTQNNPCDLFSISVNDSNSENEAVVENGTFFIQLARKKV